MNLWELDLPAIEREAVAIQAPPYVLAGLASSLASQLPQVIGYIFIFMCVLKYLLSGYIFTGPLPDFSVFYL
ncbi:hypothetical protein EMIT053CA3_40191 [Pseudomonas donghuensis]